MKARLAAAALCLPVATAQADSLTLSLLRAYPKVDEATSNPSIVIYLTETSGRDFAKVAEVNMNQRIEGRPAWAPVVRERS